MTIRSHNLPNRAMALDRLEAIYSKDLDTVAILFAFLLYRKPYSCRDILAGLLDQIIRSHPPALAHMRHLLSRARASREESVTEKELTRALIDIAPLLSKIIIVIDGLDEASDRTKIGLLKALSDLADAEVNVVIMSRPLPHLSSIYLPNALSVAIQARTDDIDLYVRKQIEESWRLRAIVKNDNTIVETISNKVKKQSDGM